MKFIQLLYLSTADGSQSPGKVSNDLCPLPARHGKFCRRRSLPPQKMILWQTQSLEPWPLFH